MKMGRRRQMAVRQAASSSNAREARGGGEYVLRPTRSTCGRPTDVISISRVVESRVCGSWIYFTSFPTLNRETHPAT